MLTVGILKMIYDQVQTMGLDSFIYFWKPDEKEGEITKACLCQWYPCHFYVDDIKYNCAEQYMMAEKARIFGDKEIRAKILSESDPEKIKKLGREVKNFVPNIWDAISADVVVKGNYHKFSQNPNLLSYLLSTEKKVLVEASPYDKIWGIGMSEKEAYPLYPHVWKGENKLGFALMEVRDILSKMK